MRELYGEEVDELFRLADLLAHPERYGCKLDRGDRPEAAAILDTGIQIIETLRQRRYIRPHEPNTPSSDR